jgi:MYXO-CTERM domain-containing protein
MMCTSTDGMAGMCTMQAPEPDAGLFVPGKLGGGGCDCGVVSAGNAASRGAWSGVLVALGFWLRSRRRRK